MNITRTFTLSPEEIQGFIDGLSKEQLEAIRIKNNWVVAGQPVLIGNDSGYMVWIAGAPCSVDLLIANAGIVKQSPVSLIASQMWQADKSHSIMSSRVKFNPENIRRDIKRLKAANLGKKVAWVITTTDVDKDFEFLENDSHYKQLADGIVTGAQIAMTDGDGIAVFDDEIYSFEKDGGWANYWGEQRVTPLKAYQRGFDLGKRLPSGFTLYHNHGMAKAYKPTDTLALHNNARGNYPDENRSLGYFLAGMINAAATVGAKVVNCEQLYGLRDEEFTRFLNWERQAQEQPQNNMNPSDDGLTHWKSQPLTFMAYTNAWQPAVSQGRGMNPEIYRDLLGDINRQKNKGTYTVIYGEWFTGDPKTLFDKFWNPSGDWQKAIRGAVV
jgi:hypothetical protein